MKRVEFKNPHRKKHFEFFKAMNHPHFSICASIDVGPWIEAAKTNDQKINASLVYLLSHAANAIPELRQRIRGDTVVEHEVVHPSFAIPAAGADVFSFCEAKFDPRREVFLERVQAQIRARTEDPSMEDEEGRDDYLFMSALPWVEFTAVTHPMNYHPHDSVPRITWGKLTPRDGTIKMPVSISAHHALVDGVHLGRFFEKASALAQEGWESAEPDA